MGGPCAGDDDAVVALLHLPLAQAENFADAAADAVAHDGVAELGALGEREYGVWEHSVGVSSDVEVDEVFVVLFGAASVAFGDGTVIELGPGSVGRLRDGQSTVWTVTETLRKVYIA